MPRKALLEAGAAQGILEAEATQHQATVGAPLPPCGTIPSCCNALSPVCWGPAAGPFSQAWHPLLEVWVFSLTTFVWGLVEIGRAHV